MHGCCGVCWGNRDDRDGQFTTSPSCCGARCYNSCREHALNAKMGFPIEGLVQERGSMEISERSVLK